MSSVAVNPPKTPCTKGSNGIATATIPNICKMPGPPAPFVPTPLPNIGKSGNSPQGYSTTVKIEGNEVAIQGASFNSMGDVASKGTGGGMISMNVEGPTKFIAPGSMDVKIEGKNVQLLSDQMSNNNGPSGSPPNAATMAGLLQNPLTIEADLRTIADKCNTDINTAHGYPPGKPSGRECTGMGTEKHSCCKKAIDAENSPHVKAEEPCTKGPPGALGATYPGEIRPDVLQMSGGKVSQIFDFKFNCKPVGTKVLSDTQSNRYKNALGPTPIPLHYW